MVILSWSSNQRSSDSIEELTRFAAGRQEAIKKMDLASDAMLSAATR